MDLSEIRNDIAAFADNDEDVLIEKGTVLFQRNRQTFECQFIETAAGVEVHFNGAKLPYRKFLAEELGRLSILAEAIKQKRRDVDPYVDTQAILTDSLDRSSAASSALEAVAKECQSRPLGETKVLFLTADAGHGKTALLRRLSQRFATQYLKGETNMLLLHVDTQGRSFVRLEEAVASDLGQLRISGVFYSGVIRLIRSGLLCVAIDGFDELLAEIGFTEAYSGLGAFLKQLEGNGVVIASARSAYFEVENYAAQTRLLSSLPNTQVVMQLLRLERWSKTEAVQYFEQFRNAEGAGIDEPEQVYDFLSERLGSDHPVLHRPFLVHRMAMLLVSEGARVGEIAEELGTSRLRVVPNVIQALLKREVEEKWRDPTGQPYLSLEQHIMLLAAVADEMWIQGKNGLPAEVIQLVSEALCDTLNIPPSRRVQIVQRVTAHALLAPSATVSGDLGFDHEEFLNYFIAARLGQMLKTRDAYGLQRFCEVRSLPLIVGVWTANIEAWTDKEIQAVLERLNNYTQAEVKTTYLKQNAGLIASQLAKYHATKTDRYEFVSMYFEGDEWEGSTLYSSRFENCTFMGVDLCHCKWSECTFVNCRFDGITYDSESALPKCHFDARCQVIGVLKRHQDSDVGMRNFVPEDCRKELEALGAIFDSPAHSRVPPVPKEKRQSLETFLRIFSRNTGATEPVMKMKLGARYSTFTTRVLPLLEKNNVIRSTLYRGSGQHERYELNYPIETILKAEDPLASLVPDNLKKFWSELRGQS